MTPFRITTALAAGLSLATAAFAGAPAPDTRQGDFVHVCRGGARKGLACTVATEATDCPGSECVVQAVSGTIKGELTLIAHDSVTDWAAGTTGNRSLTVLLEVRGPAGTALLAATYQNLADPTLAPLAPTNVVAFEMDEATLRDAVPAIGGLLFAQPEARLAEQLQTLYGQTGTPALVAITDKQVLAGDHVDDELATVVRLKVKIQFLKPVL